MDDDDIVLPSDPEELEELRAQEDLEGYWKAAAPVLARNLAIVRARRAPEREAGTFSRSATETRQTRSDDEGGSGRPRKRAKVRRVSVKYPVLTLCGFLSRYHTRCLMKIYAL